MATRLLTARTTATRCWVMGGVKAKTAFLIAASALVTLGLSGAASAEFGSGFREFKQDSCDPLLTGVLTNRGYVDADLERLYGDAYSMDARRGCGFTNLGAVGTDGTGSGASSGIFPPLDPEPAQPFNPEQLNPDRFNPIPPAGNGAGENSLPTQIIGSGADPTLPDTPPDLPPTGGLRSPVIGAELDLPNLPDLPAEITPLDSSGGRSGLYARASAAYLFPGKAAGTFTAPSSATGTGTIPDNILGRAYGGSIAAGYGFNFAGLGLFSNLRSELQASYYQMNVKPFTVTGLPATINVGPTEITEGREEVYGGFLNVLADVDFGFPVKPYFGGGIGYGRRDVRYGGGVANFHKFEADGLLYQGLFGAGYTLNEQISLDLGYKYLRSFAIKGAVGESGVPGPTTTATTWNLAGRNHHIVEGGLTFRF